MIRLSLTTANTPGAVAIIQLQGNGIETVLEKLTGKTNWQAGAIKLCDFAGIDEGLAVILPTTVPRLIREAVGRARHPIVKSKPHGRPLKAADQPWHVAENRDPATQRLEVQSAQLMPHGGPRVVQRLIAHLVENLGCKVENAPSAVELYAEASSDIEADMLDAIAKAHSPAAIDLLAVQPDRWRKLAALLEAKREALHDAIASHTKTLDQLITPPTVVVVGAPNVGKSTLTNALMGKTISIVADQPGTTRDWVGGLVELNGVAVRWLDTPGLRVSDDAIEQRAIELARKAIDSADVLIAMCCPDTPWPAVDALPRTPDLWVMNKADQLECDAKTIANPQDKALGQSGDFPLLLSALRDEGLSELQHRITESLGLTDMESQLPWAFSPRLAAWLDDPSQSIAGYLAANASNKDV